MDSWHGATRNKDTIMTTPRTCATCAHRDGQSFRQDICMASGHPTYEERAFHRVCDKDFSAWVEKEAVIVRIVKCLFWR